MRFIAVESIKEGMVLGRKIYGNNGQLLLNYGAKLQLFYIEKISQLGYKGVYIEDEFSKDINIEDIIDENTKQDAIATIRRLSQKIERGNSVTKDDYGNITSIVSEMLDKIMDEKSILINMIDLKTFDDYTFSHSVNVGVISMSIGAYMDMNRLSLTKLGIAAFLHDLGKIFIPKEILNKPAKLSKEEYELMKTHPLEGYEYITHKIKVPEEVKAAVLEHHERPDGTGYPVGKKEGQITRLGSILALADVFDALTSDRPYRKGWSPSDAVEYIMANSGKQFSDIIVNAFLKKVSPYPVGTAVNLSNDSVGLVILNYPDAGLRPKIKIIKEYDEHVTPYVLDLRNDPKSFSITITGSCSDDL